MITIFYFFFHKWKITFGSVQNCESMDRELGKLLIYFGNTIESNLSGQYNQQIEYSSLYIQWHRFTISNIALKGNKYKPTSGYFYLTLMVNFFYMERIWIKIYTHQLTMDKAEYQINCTIVYRRLLLFQKAICITYLTNIRIQKLPLRHIIP